MRRLVAACFSAFLLLPVLLVTPVLAQETTCMDNGGNWHSGMENTTSKIEDSRSGVSATIDLSGYGFDICNTDFDLAADGPSAWVAIQPKMFDNPKEILQLGVIECYANINWIASGACQGENNPHFMYAFGGCLYYPYSDPYPRDLGVANLAPHQFTIWLDTQATWHLVIDNAAEGTAKHVKVPDAYIGCWSNEMREADWAVEYWDRGDSGGNNGDPTIFSDARYGRYNRGWLSPGWYSGSTGPCMMQAPFDVCRAGWYDEMRVYTNHNAF